MPDTGGAERKRTARSVYVADHLARVTITAGGWAVIAAVLGICLYLLVVTLPLFRGADTGDAVALPVTLTPGERLIEIDEYAATGVAASASELRVVSMASGATLGSTPIGGDAAVVAISRTPGTDLIAVGLADGSVRLGTVGIDARVRNVADVPAITPGVDVIDVGNGVAQRIDERSVRVIVPEIVLNEPQALPAGEGAIVALDYRRDSGGRSFLLALREDGTLVLGTVRVIRPLGGGAPRTRISSTDVRVDTPSAGVTPRGVYVLNDGSDAMVLWSDGTLQRYAASRGGREIVFAEATSLAGDIADAGVLLGSRTLVVGDRDGVVRGYSVSNDSEAETFDGRTIVRTRTVDAIGPVDDLVFSGRDRVLAIRSGSAVRITQMTSGKTLADLDFASSLGGPPGSVVISPRNTAVVGVRESASAFVPLMTPHPEVSWRALFGPVVYEGELEPGFVYQSSSGSDEAELKYSLVPLVWGTLKATVVAMIFATPLAVLAAIYSSEFMPPKWRRVVKPSIEMMASVPSVVLGFIAAMLLAPLVRDVLPAVLVGLIVTPFVVLLAAELWQVLPARIAGRTSGSRLMVTAALSLGIGVGVASVVGPAVERAMFAPSQDDVRVALRSIEPVEPEEVPAWFGNRTSASPEQRRMLRSEGLAFLDGQVVRPVEPADAAAAAAAIDAGRLAEPSIRRWLDGTIGGPFPGWFALLIAPGVLIASLAIRRVPMAASLAYTRGPMGGAVSLARFIAGAGVALMFAAAGAWSLTAIGWDTRDSVFGTFSQRNTLVVGMIMGFAVIPIIYSISEDALSSVPNSLRFASLGAGATRWQTARRVVLPVAASGVFSACMIGLGRAVGETMIVLMATGNTPEMSLNIFAGFRTLAANIAVELPEAPKDSTHFRVLFLCGLVLFAMTFLINTTAEVVRLRFRRRSSAL